MTRSCRLLFVASLLDLVALGWAASPVITDGGVVNSANYSPDIAPGMIISIYGENLAPGIGEALTIPLPGSLLGVSVEVNDGSRLQNAPLFFVSPGQINAQLPFDLASSSVEVRVRASGGLSNPQTVHTVEAAPRLFTRTQDGLGEAILVHGNYGLVSEEEPARAGEWVVLYLTGLGAVEPPLAAGAAGGSDPLNRVKAPVEVTVSGQPANIYYAGLAPYFVGLYQVNFQIPETAGAGRAEIKVAVGGRLSQARVSLECDLALNALAAGTVAASGGELNGGGARLSIPGGTLGVAAPLALYEAVGSAQYPADSAIYALEGLPESTSGPVMVSIPVPAAPAGKAYLVIEEEGGTGAMALVEAAVSGGVATATVPARAARPLQQQAASAGMERRSIWTERARRQLLYITYKIVCESLVDGRFEVCHDRGMYAQTVQSIESGIRHHLNELARLGFATGAAGTGSPVQMSFVYSLDGEPGAVRYSSFEKKNTITVQVEPPWLQVNIGHTLCHYFQAEVDRMTVFRRGADSTPWTWFHEAVAMWYDETQLQRPGESEFSFQTDGVYRNALFFLNRPLQPGGAGGYAAWEHGAGAASLIHFLGTQAGSSGWIADVTGRWTPSNSPVDALIESGIDFGVEWPAYGDAFVNDFAGFGLLESSGDVIFEFGRSWRRHFDPARDGEPLRVPWDAPDLSSFFGYIELTNDVPDDSYLEISLEQGGEHATALAYQTTHTDTNYLGQASGASSLRLSGLDASLEAGQRVWVLLANHRAVKPYNGRAPVELKFEVKAEQTDEILAKLQAQPRLRVSLKANDRCKAPGASSDYACPNVIYTNWSDQGAKYADIEWIGEFFVMEGTWYSPVSNGDRWIYYERVEGAYNPTTQTLSGSVWHKKTSENTGNGSSAGYRFRNVPFKEALPLDPGVNFEIRDAATAGYIYDLRANSISGGQEQSVLSTVQIGAGDYFWVWFGGPPDY